MSALSRRNYWFVQPQTNHTCVPSCAMIAQVKQALPESTTKVKVSVMFMVDVYFVCMYTFHSQMLQEYQGCWTRGNVLGLGSRYWFRRKLQYRLRSLFCSGHGPDQT
jgi:hypothetical protein